MFIILGAVSKRKKGEKRGDRSEELFVGGQEVDTINSNGAIEREIMASVSAR